MYKNTAVICETNPFHNGHQCVFHKAHEDSDMVTAIMSGNFVQRAIPAVFDKYTRAALLVQSGVDIVVELPYPWACGSGEAFALGGVSVAAAMGCDRLLFGSESGDTKMLIHAAEWFEREESRMRTYALTHPDAGAGVLHEQFAAQGGFTLPANDKLGVWYIRQLRRLKSTMVPDTVKRLAADAHVTGAGILREYLAKGIDCSPYVPAVTNDLIRCMPYTAKEGFFNMAHLYFRLFAGDTPCAEGEGGLWERLKKTAHSTADGTEFFAGTATKKYTDARIRRAALFGMTGVREDMLQSRPLYTILLAVSAKGREWLRSHPEDFPIITKPSDDSVLCEAGAEQYAIQRKADSLYGLCMNPPESGEYFLKKHPVIV